MTFIEQTTPKSAYYVADYLILNSTTHLTPLHINKLVFLVTVGILAIEKATYSWI